MWSSRRVGALALWAFVGCASACAQKTILVPSPGISTIQQGIDAASTGDTVLVAPGTYSGNMVIDGKEITLTSQGGPGQTILNGISSPDDSAVLEVQNTPSLATTISGFTFENPLVAQDGCVSASPGIALSSAGATIRQNVFSDVFDAVIVMQGAVTFEQNTLTLAAVGSGSCEAAVDGLVFFDIGKVVPGGGLATSTVSGNVFDGNNTGSFGILAEASGALTIDHNRFNGNTEGVVLQDVDQTVVIENNLFAYGGNGAIVVNHSDDNPPSDPANTFILNNTMYHNLNGSIIDNPQAESYLAAEINITGTYSRVAVIGNIISTNSLPNPILTCAPATGGNGPPTPIILDHNLFWNPAGQISGGPTCTVPLGSFGNINADPKFVSSTDLHLTASSPAIDAGTTGSGYLESTDLDGNPRVQDSAGGGYPLIDIGAYEFSGRQDADVTTLVLTSSDYYLRTGNSLTLTAQLTDVTTASPLDLEPVAFHVDGGAPVLVNTDSSGHASLPVSGLKPGLHTFTAEFAGISNRTTHPAAPAAAVVLYAYVVYGAPYELTELTLTSSQNPSNLGEPVTLSVQSFSPDGTHPGPIALADGGTLLANLTPDAAGLASFTTSMLAVGTRALTATFAGDAVHEPATVSLAQVVQPAADFSLTSSASSIAILTKHHASLTLTVTSIGAFAGPVQLACGSLPEYASCTFADPALQLSPGASATTTLTLDTDAVRDFAAIEPHRTSSGLVALACLSPLFLFGGRAGRRRRFPPMALGILLLPITLALSGCTGLLPGHTPPGTYTVPVTGTAVVDGVLTTHTLNLTLVVTP